MSTLGFSAPPAWMESALCAEVDPEIFHPPKGGSVAAAKQVCAACPVFDQCHAYAMANDEPHGVWAGTTAVDRRKARRQMRKAS